MPAVDLRRELCDQNVFVFHLPAEWSEDDLNQEFTRFGGILSAKVVKRPDGSSKGYGFVCFHTPHSAENAVKEMDGHTVGGKRLKVSLKKTPEECLSLQVRKLMEISDSNKPFDKDKDCTLFVFHLPGDWDDTQLSSQFQPYGQLASAKVAKKEDGTSRGYGFVTFQAPRSAAVAITNMNGVDVGQGKRLKVQLKQSSQSHHPLPGCTIFVFHLPNDWEDEHLRQHFSHYGRILNATVQKDAKGNSRGYGFVSFEQPHHAINAISGMNGFSVGNKRLKVSIKQGEESSRYMTSYSMHRPANYFLGRFPMSAPTHYPVNPYTASMSPSFPGHPHQGYPTYPTHGGGFGATTASAYSAWMNNSLLANVPAASPAMLAQTHTHTGGVPHAHTQNPYHRTNTNLPHNNHAHAHTPATYNNNRAPTGFRAM